MSGQRGGMGPPRRRSKEEREQQTGAQGNQHITRGIFTAMAMPASGRDNFRVDPPPAQKLQQTNVPEERGEELLITHTGAKKWMMEDMQGRDNFEVTQPPQDRNKNLKNTNSRDLTMGVVKAMASMTSGRNNFTVAKPSQAHEKKEMTKAKGDDLYQGYGCNPAMPTENRWAMGMVPSGRSNYQVPPPPAPVQPAEGSPQMHFVTFMAEISSGRGEETFRSRNLLRSETTTLRLQACAR